MTILIVIQIIEDYNWKKMVCGIFYFGIMPQIMPNNESLQWHPMSIMTSQINHNSTPPKMSQNMESVSLSWCRHEYM